MRISKVLLTFVTDISLTIKPKSWKGLEIMKIQEIIDEIRKSEAGIMSIVLADASRYAKNSEGPMTWAGTLFTKKYANRRNGDEVITTGTKETNLSEVERVLRSLIGKGDVQIHLTNMKWINGEVEA